MKKIQMHIFNAAVLAFTISATSTTSAQAHDSFSLGINIGGYGFAPPPTVYYAPPPVYYSPAPVVYYQAAPRYYGYGPSFAPIVSYHYFNGGGHHGYRGNGWGRGNWDRDDGGRGRGDWGRSGRDRGGWDRDGGHHRGWR